MSKNSANFGVKVAVLSLLMYIKFFWGLPTLFKALLVYENLLFFFFFSRFSLFSFLYFGFFLFWSFPLFFCSLFEVLWYFPRARSFPNEWAGNGQHSLAVGSNALASVRLVSMTSPFGDEGCKCTGFGASGQLDIRSPLYLTPFDVRFAFDRNVTRLGGSRGICIRASPATLVWGLYSTSTSPMSSVVITRFPCSKIS